MKNLGFALLTIGFILGCYVTCFDPEIVDWQLFIPAAVTSAAGVFVARRASHAAARSEEKTSGDIEILRASVANLVESIGRLDADKATIDPYEAGPRIDREIRDDLDAFAEARETISHVWGVQAFADLMSHFATCERYLNRVWSSGADGYIDEVRTYIGKAKEQIDMVNESFRRLDSGA